MDDGYMPAWNDCYAKINEMYKENIDMKAKINKHAIELKQAQDMIDELEMLKVAQNSIIKALNEALSDRQEFIDKQQEMIDRLESKRVSNLHLIKEQKEHITTLTTTVENLKEVVNTLSVFIDFIDYIS